MKKGHDIKEMLQKVNDDANYKKDFVVNLKALRVQEGVKSFPELKVLGYDGTPQLTDHALNQLCGRLEIGTLYINKCLPVSQSLVAHNLNFWISNNKDRDLMLRTYENFDKSKYVRAILSNRYKMIDAHHVLNPALNKIMDLGAEFKYSHYDGDRLNVTATLPKLEGEVQKDDIVQGGITITNSEIGNGGLLIQPFIYRLVCTNGMVAPRYLNRFFTRHVGKIVIDPEKDTQWVSIIDKMQKQIELVSNPEVFQENLQKLKDATNEKITSHKIVEVTKKHGITDYERKEIFERLEHYVGETFTTSKYDFANAITNVANSDDRTEDRTRFLQELGGLIIFAHNPNAVRLR